MTEVLLPCPFCEGSGVLWTGEDGDYYNIECESCGCETAAQDTEAMAILKWNTRPKALGRDEIARIIDPQAFMTVDEERPTAYQQRKQTLALERADAILGTIPAPKNPMARQWDDTLKMFRYPDDE